MSIRARIALFAIGLASLVAVVGLGMGVTGSDGQQCGSVLSPVEHTGVSSLDASLDAVFTNIDCESARQGRLGVVLAVSFGAGGLVIGGAHIGASILRQQREAASAPPA